MKTAVFSIICGVITIINEKLDVKFVEMISLCHKYKHIYIYTCVCVCVCVCVYIYATWSCPCLDKLKKTTRFQTLDFV
jgi:hypothetical protein